MTFGGTIVFLEVNNFLNDVNKYLRKYALVALPLFFLYSSASGGWDACCAAFGKLFHYNVEALGSQLAAFGTFRRGSPAGFGTSFWWDDGGILDVAL